MHGCGPISLIGAKPALFCAAPAAAQMHFTAQRAGGTLVGLVPEKVGKIEETWGNATPAHESRNHS